MLMPLLMLRWQSGLDATLFERADRARTCGRQQQRQKKCLLSRYAAFIYFQSFRFSPFRHAADTLMPPMMAAVADTPLPRRYRRARQAMLRAAAPCLP